MRTPSPPGDGIREETVVNVLFDGWVRVPVHTTSCGTRSTTSKVEVWTEVSVISGDREAQQTDPVLNERRQKFKVCSHVID